MTFASRFFSTALSLLLLPMVLFAVPLHPDTQAQLHSSGQLEIARAAYLEAHHRGMDQPTSRPLDMKAMGQVDRLDLQVLTILVDFSDNPANQAQFPVEHYQEMLYSVNTFPTGSLRDYYLENSCGDVHIVGDVAGWYRMPQTYDYYVASNYGFGSYPHNAQRLTEDAVWAADPDIDFSVYDNDNDGYVDALFVVHAGPGAEQTGNVNDIWSHAWVTNNVPYVDGVHVYSYSQEPENGHIGVFGHELGHALFGLPDLYDYGYDSHGTGYWSMMSVGCWGGGGVTPVHFDAWCKIKAGFFDAINVTSDETNVEIPQVETTGVIYRLWMVGAIGPQYYLVENRQEVGFDVSLPSSGLVIYHIEEQSGSNNNQWYPGYTSYGHYLVAVEQADGDWDLEQYSSSGDAGDPWPGSSGATTFDAFSTPDSKDYNFQPTEVSISNITPSAALMYADFQVGLPTPSGQEVVLTYNFGSPVPAGGGNLNFDVYLANNETYSVNFDLWIEIPPQVTPPSVPNRNLTFPGGYSITRPDMNWPIPGNWPAGTYDMVWNIGDLATLEVWASDSFPFTKSAVYHDRGFAGWEIVGDPLDQLFDGTDFSKSVIVGEFELLGAYPNPFNPTTVITYQLQDARSVKLSVFDVNGRLITELVNGFRNAGQHEVTFDASRLPSGIYFYRIRVGEYDASGKMVLMK